MINRKQVPEIIDPVAFDIKLPPCGYYELDNKVPVYTINAGAQEVISLEWVFYAGNSFEEKNIVAATTNFLLKNGTKGKSAFEISEHFEFYGAYLHRHCYNETATITLHCLSRHLPHLLPVVAEMITDAVFPEKELSIYKQNQKQHLQVNLKKCDFIANRLIDQYLYGKDHPYGKFSSEETYNALEREELIRFYQQYYTNGKYLLFAAGKLPVDLQQQLNSYFGQLPFNRQLNINSAVATQPASEKKYNISNDANGVQAAIRIARHFPNRHHPDFPKVQVLNNIFGGYFGSRLMSNIREDKGYTYGIHSFLHNHINHSAWAIGTEAGRDVAEATIKEIYKEMDLLRKELVDEEELHLVRNHMIGSILGELDGPFHIISRWKNYILNNLSESYFYNAIHTIKTISAEELCELANVYLKKEDFYELRVV